MPERTHPDGWEEITRALGDRVRELRMRRGMSQEMLGHFAGLSRNQVQNIENGRGNRNAQGHQRLSNPTLETLWAIASVLKVEPSELLRRLPKPGGDQGKPLR